MLPYASSLPCNGFGVKSNINGLLNDIRPNSMLIGVNQNHVASLLNPNPVQLSVNVNNHSNKDSQWLTLEVCREYQRSMCPRNELECKYAHPPPYIETQNGRVMCCYDSIKGKCHRIKPPCKYLHPPQHLKDLLIQNGKNNLLMKNLQMNIMQQQLSNFSGNSPSRLGFLSMNNDNNGEILYPSQLQLPSVISTLTQKMGNENQKLSSSPEQKDSTTSSDQTNYNKSLHNNYCVSNEATHPQTNLNKFSNFYECQLTKCMSNNNLSVTSVPVTVTTVSDTSCKDLKNTRKRPLPLQNPAITKTDQSMEKPVPLKKLNVLETQLPGMSRDQQTNPLGFIVNPLMAYQNQLASYLSLNNQAGLQSNSINFPTFLTSNNAGLLSLGPSLICPNTLINFNSLPMLSTMPNQQQQLATTLLQAANAIQYNRSLAEFNGFH